MIRMTMRALGTGIAITLFLAIALSVAVWFLGPLAVMGDWAPLTSTVQRLTAIGGICLVALTIMLIVLIVRARRAKKMTEEIVDAVDDEIDEEDELVKAELADLKGKLREALTTLRKSKLGRRSLYELPWYVMIGPPGAGKTTAIVNSGLQFPLAETTGAAALSGVGGTRNCDWWFTNNAVLIDTAGRYTTQDSGATEDNAAWLGFLNLLKKYRKRQPINGAIVAISLSDLTLQDEATQRSHAAAIRRRLHELRDKLGVQFPVYVLFTKSDLIAGFTEFYDNLGKEDREQVWGFTLPVPKKTKGELSPVAAFDEEFAGLLGQLNAQTLDRLQTETDHQRRSLIASFPPQVASVRATAREFLSEVFQDNRFEKRHLLRGVYFTSGTQEGTPIDRLMMGMARTFGIGRQAIGTGRGTGRSFFLTRLFEEVMFPEAGLVSADDKVERRYKISKYAAIAAAIVVAAWVSTLWVRSFLGNSALLAQAAEAVETYRAESAAIPGSPIQDTDLPGIVPALNTLRALPANPAAGDPDPDRALQWGLYQGKVVGNQAAQTYRAALNEHLLPRLLLRLEEQMQASMDRPEFLYEALKVYLMLGQQGPMYQDLVKDWMNLEWSVSYAGPGREELRADLAGHLDALLAAPMDRIALNGPLVEQSQQLLAEMPLAQRVYNGIINSPTAQALPPWRLTDIGGPAITRVMSRSSGKPMTEGIEGIFTYDGFTTVFLDEALGLARRLQKETWVLGEAGESEQSERALAAMSEDVVDLYYNDFIARYDQILGDLDIVPLESLSHAVEVTNVLSGPTSPIVNVLEAVSEETRLTEDRTVLPGGELAEGAATVAGLELQSELSGRASMFLGILSTAATAEGRPPPDPPGTFVEERFSWLHELVLPREEGLPSELENLQARLTEVYQELNRLSFQGGAGAGAGAGEGATALVRFQEAAQRSQGPLERWATQIAQGSSGITADGTRAGINALWQSQVLPFCEQVLDGRYPFDRGAAADVAIGDFSRLFAPNGLIDSFFNENLRDYVDMRARPWAWKRVNDADLGISDAVLQQFQYAAEIRDAFFAGGSSPAVSFQVTPEALDPAAEAVQLEIDGERIQFRHTTRSPRPTAVTWPGAVGQARVVFAPLSAGASNDITREGPWAWFRLLNAAEIRRTNVSDRNRVIFNVGGRIAIFQLQSGSVLNPFALPALSEFSCPKSF
ncbi:MAG: type VI secretion system membrane subunit TssM [Pseudomonadota bacterium]